jgi:hypothetical protein
MASVHSASRKRATGITSTPLSSRRSERSEQTMICPDRGVFSERVERLRVALAHASAGFDLDGDSIADNEVDLDLRPRPVVGEPARWYTRLSCRIA